MKTVNIFGCCVSRDIIPKNQGLYDVQQYVSFSSPMVATSPPPKSPLSMDDISDFVGTSFSKRCMILDYNKQGFEYLKERPSDYLIIDLADARVKIVQSEDGLASFLNFMLHNQEKFERLLGKFILQEPDYWPEAEWMEHINLFCDKVLQLYDANRIILNEVFCVDAYVSKTGTLLPFSQKIRARNQRVNALIRKLYAVCEERFFGCHIIRLPQRLFADANNKWGLYPLHYHRIYYQYAYEALQAITEGPPAEENETLKRLYEKCDLQLRLRQEQCRTLLARHTNHKYETYVKYFSSIISHYDELLIHVRNFCSEHQIGHVAFYGDFKTTESLMPFLSKCGVTFDYVVGYWNHHEPLPLISPKAERFPETDALIICDVMNIDRIRTALQDKVDFPVHTIYDFLPDEEAQSNLKSTPSPADNNFH